MVWAEAVVVWAEAVVVWAEAVVVWAVVCNSGNPSLFLCQLVFKKRQDFLHCVYKLPKKTWIGHGLEYMPL